MTKYKCSSCRNTFDEDERKEIETTYEEYFGVNGDFPYNNPMTYYVCPYCESQSYEEIDEDDEEE